MLASILGVALIFFGLTQASNVQPYPKGYVYIEHHTKQGVVADHGVVVDKPFSSFAFQNVVHQAYDYSCGSAALTTVLDNYLGHDFNERQVMEGLLRFGETQKIVKRRGFSLLDMKRLATALGYQSGGFKATFKDLETLKNPAVVPIHYAGFKHFVVLKKFKDGHVYIADPAMGNISFTQARFAQVWTKNVLFIIFPKNGEAPKDKLQLTDWDMRLVDDRTLTHLAYQQFEPLVHFTAPAEHRVAEAASLQRVLTTDVDNKEKVLNIPTRTYYKQD
jgi:predicted double-glycine peptidase